MKIKERYQLFIDYFSENMPEAKTELHYSNPFQLLIAVILSAQCTDKRVNLITPQLFEQYKTPQQLANANISDVLSIIKSCSYPNNKAKHLVGMAQGLINQFEGKIPQSIEELQKLPGVGRKTANVIASVAFDIPAMPVDTHVFRVSQRIGLVNNAKKPLDVEIQLTKYIPKNKLNLAHHWLILHGRYTCKAKNPTCKTCGINHFCKFFKKIT